MTLNSFHLIRVEAKKDGTWSFVDGAYFVFQTKFDQQKRRFSFLVATMLSLAENGTIANAESWKEKFTDDSLEFGRRTPSKTIAETAVKLGLWYVNAISINGDV